jgi:hypothetical protein
VLSLENLKTGADSTPEEMDEERTHWAALRTSVRKRIGESSVICIPTRLTLRRALELNLTWRASCAQRFAP